MFREAVPGDVTAIMKLYRAAAAIEGGVVRNKDEITETYVQDFVRKSMDGGLIIVGEHPELAGEFIAAIHAYKTGIAVFDHVLSHTTLVVHPDFQGRQIGKTLLTIFLDEIARNRPDIGKVELITRESNTRAINLYQSRGFRIEGRMEMRIRTREGTYEADIPMGWQNPNFEF